MDCYQFRIDIVDLHFIFEAFFNFQPNSFPQLLWHFLVVVGLSLDPQCGNGMRLFLPFLNQANLKAMTAVKCFRFSFTCPDLFVDAKERSQLLLLLPKDLPVDQGGDEGGEEGGGAGEGDAGGVAGLGSKLNELNEEIKVEQGGLCMPAWGEVK